MICENPYIIGLVDQTVSLVLHRSARSNYPKPAALQRVPKIPNPPQLESLVTNYFVEGLLHITTSKTQGAEEYYSFFCVLEPFTMTCNINRPLTPFKRGRQHG